MATPHLPTGALVNYLELDYCDTNSTSGEDVSVTFYDCDYHGGACVPKTLISSGTGSTGCHFLPDSGLGYTVDNNNREMVLAVQTVSGDNTNSFSGVVLGYRLQVSPAPGSPTFADVPTTHTYFRAIEALASSGITAGCGGGNYCPAANVTRGEMAAFLARALGLHLPD